ncbi:LysE family translocator [Oceanimonas baumannii]|uniref:Amino acid transporter n=1 Tax=Oceanimonas baumannii TaxID=129578 RepID=A0A235CEU7_9GAMM|nr:LysE family translocator [Oceanimonas baumannii]OYD23151.1 amino acid transporter [Oceanimonas baumannii]TDW58424.1 threonine/homoserine/homoserine lactone efflux protein [Oceanimonas baumannii]
MEHINYFLIVFSAIAAIASPGPATLAIAGASMGKGRLSGLHLAFGVLTGSLIWSILAAFGLAAVLRSNVWLFEVLRYLGAFYLLYLAYKSLTSALNPMSHSIPEVQLGSKKSNYLKGLLIHLTNPKAILFFGALYSMGVPNTATPKDFLSVVVVVGLVSAVIFISYAVIFSHAGVRSLYIKSKAIFEGVFAVFFGSASCKLLLSDIEG